jgi:hydroxypyruvate reductase 1
MPSPLTTCLRSPLSPQATLAAANVAGVLQGYGAWTKPNDITPFLDGPIPSLPRAAPSIVNAKEIGLPAAT